MFQSDLWSINQTVIKGTTIHILPSSQYGICLKHFYNLKLWVTSGLKYTMLMSKAPFMAEPDTYVHDQSKPDSLDCMTEFIPSY